MNTTDTLYIAGHTGLVGSALIRHAIKASYSSLATRTQHELDLRTSHAVDTFFAQTNPAYVFMAAAYVGGISANILQPASFIYNNLAIGLSVLHAAYRYGVKKLLFFGSSCIYPRDCLQPIREDYLLTGPLEPSNKPYALAKIALLELCQSYNRQYGTQFISCMPTNLYGPHDNFDPSTSHVIPGLIARIYKAYIEDAPSVAIWGSGNARREFLFIEDLATAAFFLMQHYDNSAPINVGFGSDITIHELAYLIKEFIGYNGSLYFDTSKPDGTPQKLLNSNRITALGWQPQTPLEIGLKKTIDWFIANHPHSYVSHASERFYD
jgi:GDP-L-fucose synthase